VKKYIVFIVLIVGFMFLQSSTLYDKVSIRGVTPDFLLITISLSAFFLGPVPGQIIGFVTGFILDIIQPVGLLGLSAFSYTLIGYGVGIIGQKVYGNSVLITITLMFIVTLLKAAVLSMLAAIFLKAGYFGYFVQGRIFLEAVLNSVITPLLFLIIGRVEREFVT
jgi:rod shape-determining protein MreD